MDERNDCISQYTVKYERSRESTQFWLEINCAQSNIHAVAEWLAHRFQDLVVQVQIRVVSHG